MHSAGEGSQREPAKLSSPTKSNREIKRAEKLKARLIKERQGLPIWKSRNELIDVLKTNSTVILMGETGSGKTTQLPQILLDSVLPPGAVVACTQPRRVAALTIAHRVARERACNVGGEVGYSVRFDDKSSPQTRLKYMTDGMLLREALLDPLLRRYKAIVLDEAHERTVQTDVLFGLVKKAQAERGPQKLRLIIMSATLDAAKFVKYFPGARAVHLQGRQFPVEIFYTEQPEQSYVEAAIMTVLQLHATEAPGHILVFLTGQEEIEAVESLLNLRGKQVEGSAGMTGMQIVPLFAAQGPDQQAAAFQSVPPEIRKVILATNVAETSVTVPGVRYVVDSGCVKARSFQAAQALETLQVMPVSQAQARQRSGRAGREAPGKAMRLYTEDAFWSLEATTIPEVQRVRLDSVCLQLKALGIEDPLKFDFIDPPLKTGLIRFKGLAAYLTPRSGPVLSTNTGLEHRWYIAKENDATTKSALNQLHALGALDESGKLTEPLGTSLAKLPVDPTFGRVLLAAAENGCLTAALSVVAVSASDQIFAVRRQQQETERDLLKRFGHMTGDHLTQLAVFSAFTKAQKDKREWCSQNHLNFRSLQRATSIYDQLVDYMHGLGHSLGPMSEAEEVLAATTNSNGLRRALTAGLFMNAAVLQPDGTYRVIQNNQIVHIHPASVLSGKKAKCIVFGELICTSRNYARGVTAIEAAWLPEIAPTAFSRSSIHTA